MLKVSIFKNGTQTHGAEFESQQLLDQWLEKHKAQHTFGKPAQYESVFNEATGEYTSVEVVPAEAFDVVITDITAELNQAKVNEAALKLLAETDWLIVRELETGVVCPPEIKQARAIARASIIR